MENIEKIEQLMQEIANNFALGGASHEEETHTQKVPARSSKRLLTILLTFLAGAVIAGFATYNYILYTARTENINRVDHENSLNIKQEVMPPVKEKATDVQPEKQGIPESRIKDGPGLSMKHNDAHINALAEEPVKRTDQKAKYRIKESGSAVKPKEDSRIQQGWSFYGVLQGHTWETRFFNMFGKGDPDVMPSPGDSIVSKGRVNIRNTSPAYSPETGWSYALASVIGGVQKFEITAVTQVASVDTPKGKYVWVKLLLTEP